MTDLNNLPSKGRRMPEKLREQMTDPTDAANQASHSADAEPKERYCEHCNYAIHEDINACSKCFRPAETAYVPVPQSRPLDDHVLIPRDLARQLVEVCENGRDDASSLAAELMPLKGYERYDSQIEWHTKNGRTSRSRTGEAEGAAQMKRTHRSIVVWPDHVPAATIPPTSTDVHSSREAAEHVCTMLRECPYCLTGECDECDGKGFHGAEESSDEQ